MFYHTQLHCYVVIELKIGAFMPEYAGKLNFYLSAVDNQMRNGGVDLPTIGILLCKEKNRVITEYALRDMTKPMAVSTYHLKRTLPSQLITQLPSPEKLKEVMLACDISGTGSFEVSVEVKKKASKRKTESFFDRIPVINER